MGGGVTGLSTAALLNHPVVLETIYQHLPRGAVLKPKG